MLWARDRIPSNIPFESPSDMWGVDVSDGTMDSHYVGYQDPQKRRETDFLQGAKLKDPKKLFNTRLESKTFRAIDFHEAHIIDDQASKL